MKRRDVFRTAALGTSGMAASGIFTKVVSARYPYYEYCTDYIQDLKDAGMTDSEAHNYFEDVHDAECSSGGVQSTSSSGPFPISACQKVSLFGEEYCLSTSYVDSNANRSCGPDNTRDLDAAVDITFERTKLDEGITFDHQFWIGVRENPFNGNLCFEIGQETAGICFSTCTPSGTPTSGEMQDAMEDMMEWANKNIMDEEIGEAVLFIIIAIFVAVAAGLSCVVTGSTC